MPHRHNHDGSLVTHDHRYGHAGFPDPEVSELVDRIAAELTATFDAIGIETTVTGLPVEGTEPEQLAVITIDLPPIAAMALNTWLLDRAKAIPVPF